jgi:ATP-dependent RNA helicase SUPV3L1/SUV3
MMSILGATAEDMEEILKGLGYRAEPKPAAEVKARLEAEDEAVRRAAEAKAAAATANDGAEGEVATVAVDSSATSSEVAEDEVAVEQAAANAPEGGSEIADEVAVQSAAEQPISEIAAPAEADGTTVVAEAVPTGDVGNTTEAEEPKPILLWRQARFERHRGGQRQDQRQRGAQGRHQKVAGAEAGPENQGEAKGGSGERRRFDRDRFKNGKPQGEGRPEHRGGKSQGQRQERRDGQPDWKAGKSGGKPHFQSKPREERPVRIDPDSPFAKLAALRDQLKK